MTFNAASFEAYLDANHERFMEELRQLIAIPSVAADNRGIQEGAEAVATRLAAIGAEVQILPTPNNGNPVVYAEVGSGDQTILIYDHYDVQPESPLELWESPPFELHQRDGRLYGRGVADNKGDLLSRIQAVEAWQQTQGPLPLRLKFVIEGEEEIGSVNLHAWVDEYKHLLDADGVIWEGSGYDEDGIYKISEGCKGIAYFELNVQGPAFDLHSSLAPIIPNPAWRLVWALSSMKDSQDRISLDGYWEHVADVPPQTLEQIDSLPFAAEKMRQNYGIREWINGMDDQSAQRRYYVEPTLTICGLESGYTETGSKTVLPAKAMAKLDFRLVPNLTPELVQNLLRQHLDARGFNDIEITLLGGENPSMRSSDSPLKDAAVKAYTQIFGEAPVQIPWLAGSGPMYALSDYLDIPVVALGPLWHPMTRAHSPNENIFVKDYFDSMRLMAAVIRNLA